MHPGRKLTPALACAAALALALPAAAGAKVLAGNPGPETLRGSVASVNVINGDGGPDKIYGGALNTTIDCGPGGDTVKIGLQPAGHDAQLRERLAPLQEEVGRVRRCDSVAPHERHA